MPKGVYPRKKKEPTEFKNVSGVAVTKEAWKEIRIQAIREDRPIYEVLGEAITEYVDRRNGKR